MLSGIVFRKENMLTCKDDVLAFIASGRPSFIMCTLTTIWSKQPDGRDIFHIHVHDYDVSNKRKKKNNGYSVQQG